LTSLPFLLDSSHSLTLEAFCAFRANVVAPAKVPDLLSMTGFAQLPLVLNHSGLSKGRAQREEPDRRQWKKHQSEITPVHALEESEHTDRSEWQDQER
jgi:hypothetical protein